ncbi:hypothetical protein BKA93DRAFT_570855 [Sparassis latifolia]|uniref:Uncharacterized protein n=1 Tax=Sparassis crispa TaxID=139825 RepID=A0A401GYP3_9APHY|nr:hypothetical protein SCP_1005350 [Sparassis crispa]GBE87287.1 hypothetical protein SCP_1005350 [Sparassis crispa]
MSFLSVPTISNLPTLSESGTGDSADPSPLPSGLCTPGETYLHSGDDILIASKIPFTDDRFIVAQDKSLQVQLEQLRDSKIKAKPLSRVVSQAKKLAGRALSVRKAFRKSSETLNASLSSSSLGPDFPGGWKAERVTQSEARLSISSSQEIVSRIGAGREDGDESIVQTHSSSDYHPETLGNYSHVDPDELFNFFEELLSSDTAHDSYWKLPSLHTATSTILRITLFLPWCAAVGGTVLLSPQHLELVAFTPGYIASPKGLQRFAHWTDCATHHVFIFLACIIALALWDVALGTAVAGVALARFIYVWSDFRVDASVPLGEDDKQSVYLAVTQAYINDGDLVFRTSKTDNHEGNRLLDGDAMDEEGEEEERPLVS